VRGNEFDHGARASAASIRDSAGLEPAFKGSSQSGSRSGGAGPEPPQRVAAFAGTGSRTCRGIRRSSRSFRRAVVHVRASNGSSATISAEELASAATSSSGLTNDAPIAFTVTASNEAATSQESLPSLAVTPSTRRANADAPQRSPRSRAKGWRRRRERPLQAPTVVVNGAPAGSDGGSSCVVHHHGLTRGKKLSSPDATCSC